MGAIAMRIRARRARPAAQQMLDLIRRQGSGGAAFLPGVPLASGAHWLSGASSIPTPSVLGLDGVTRATTPWLAAYVESTASTPAAVDGPVGFLSDGEGAVGAELAPATLDFTTAAWYKGNGATAPSANVINFPAVSAEVIQQATGVNSANKSYFIRFTATGNGTLSVGVSNTVDYAPRTQLTLTATPQTFTCKIDLNGTNVANAALSFCRLTGDTCTQATITAASWKQLNGRHATQNSGSAKPTMRRGLVNQTYYSQQIGNGAGWSTWNAGSITTTSAPDGSSTATQFTVTAGPGGRFQAGHSVTSGVPVTSMMIAKPVSGGSQLQLTVAANSAYGGTGGDRVLVIDGATGALVNKSAEVTGYSVEPLAGGYWLIVGNCTPTSTSSTDAIAAYGVATGQVLAAWMAGRVTGTLTAKQILAAGGIPLTTTIAASGSGGNHWLQSNGSSTAMSLPGPVFSFTDDCVVVAGLRIDVATGGGYFMGAAAAANSGTAARAGVLAVGPSNMAQAYWTSDAGTFFVCNAGTITPGAPFVMSAVQRSGLCKARVNGGGWSNTVNPNGAATLNAAGLCSAYGFQTLNGAIWGWVAFKGTFSDAEVAVLERGIAALCPIPGALRF